jgi:hypothetical protein
LPGAKPRKKANKAWQLSEVAYKRLRTCYDGSRRNLFNRREGRNAMAKGQMRSNKEKKKPKADKNLKKGGMTPVNPFAAGKTPAGQSPNSKKN